MSFRTVDALIDLLNEVDPFTDKLAVLEELFYQISIRAVSDLPTILRIHNIARNLFVSNSRFKLYRSYSPGELSTVSILTSRRATIGGIHCVIRAIKSIFPNTKVICTEEYFSASNSCLESRIESLSSEIINSEIIDMTESSDMYAQLALFCSGSSHIRFIHDSHQLSLGSIVSMPRRLLSLFKSDSDYIAMVNLIYGYFGQPMPSVYKFHMPLRRTSTSCLSRVDSNEFTFAFVGSFWKIKLLFLSPEYWKLVDALPRVKFLIFTDSKEILNENYVEKTEFIFGQDFIAHRHKFDILLDTFPEPGGLAPFETLMSGIPVIPVEVWTGSSNLAKTSVFPENAYWLRMLNSYGITHEYFINRISSSANSLIADIAPLVDQYIAAYEKSTPGQYNLYNPDDRICAGYVSGYLKELKPIEEIPLSLKVHKMLQEMLERSL